jgi:hypothetical protein
LILKRCCSAAEPGRVKKRKVTWTTDFAKKGSEGVEERRAQREGEEKKRKEKGMTSSVLKVS